MVLTSDAGGAQVRKTSLTDDETRAVTLPEMLSPEYHNLQASQGVSPLPGGSTSSGDLGGADGTQEHY